ncbi:exonuclease SbcCD subunit D [Falsarthrobacter nasiphocae]|uniref:Nuclease SbcCD subunit D n=1 Tax=Falsarthrobacter nasiphocae TaxID=189863 RepID=A0AAE3YFE4_9MICC|nr:exonuclease SbcCD subunit D [Falsarthrobacter nasiphocae]MDR6892803.1 exonuclease SbcD [Falsarthrobacter nasiphocae]
MRIFHTSDWHLGRQFHGASLRESFESWASFVVETVRERAVDVLVIAGDVYDRAYPPVWAVELVDETLARVRDAGAAVVLSPGNHDSATRLGFGASILRHGGVHIGADVHRIGEPVTLTGRSGAAVDFFMLPFLDTSLLRVARPEWLEARLGEEPADTESIHRAALETMRDAAKPGRPAVVLAHSFVRGGTSTDSEREIRPEVRQGGLGEIPAGLFEGFAYAALGHLHRRQRIADSVRYSGSPIPFSFSEAGHRKGGLMVEVSPGGDTSISEVDFRGFRAVSRIEGTLEELLADPALAAAEEHFVSATLTDTERPAEPMRRLRTRFPLALEIRTPNIEMASAGGYAQRVRRATSRGDVVEMFYSFVRGRALDAEERPIVASVLEDVAAAERSA